MYTIKLNIFSLQTLDNSWIPDSANGFTGCNGCGGLMYSDVQVTYHDDCVSLYSRSYHFLAALVYATCFVGIF